MINVNPDHLTRSHSVRASLKRGLAKQVVRAALRTDADLSRLFRDTVLLRPNRRSAERLARRTGKRQGVVSTAIAASGRMVFVARNVRHVSNRVDCEEVFEETALIYTRASLRASGGTVLYRICRASFCLHAIERFIERSSCAIDAGLLSRLDAEAVGLLKSLNRTHIICHDGDSYLSADAEGVWAGSVDESGLEPDWCLDGSAPVAMFSVRTFLGPDQMKPEVWLKWNGDASLTIA